MHSKEPAPGTAFRGPVQNQYNHKHAHPLRQPAVKSKRAGAIPLKDQRITSFEEALGRSVRRLIGRSSRVLIAVSGGPDSVALLSGLSALAGRLELTLEAATVDHQLRPESAAEAALVKTLADRLGVPHVTLPVVVRDGGLEAAARSARYAALERHRLARGLDLVATAHTADDQAETLLMRLMRGTATGAGAIHELRPDGVVRPLLFARRPEVMAYVEACQLPTVHDPMNDDPRFLRVRVRQGLMPKVVELGGDGAVRALARYSAWAAEDEAWLSAQASELAKGLLLSDGSLDARGLTASAPALQRRVLAGWLEGQGVELTAEAISEGLRACREGGQATLPNDRVLACQNGRAVVVSAPARLHATSS